MSLWPQVADWLVTTAPTLPAFASAQVYDGEPLSGDTGSFLAVGYVVDENGGGSVRYTTSGDGWSTHETGEVRCTIWAGNGDGSMSQARTDSFALADAIRAAIGTGGTLNGTLPQGTDIGVVVAVVPTQAENGTASLLVLSITYDTPYS